MQSAVGSHGDDIDFLFKLVIVGDSGVGKTSLLLKYVDDVFTETFISTIGVDFKIRSFDMDGKKIKLQIWDTAGQDRFRNIVSSFYRNAHGILVVYDVTDLTSFQNLHYWLTEVDRYAGSEVKQVLVGNKCDLQSRRVVTSEVARALAEKSGMLHHETSAKTSDSVEALFVQLTEKSGMLHHETSAKTSGSVEALFVQLTEDLMKKHADGEFRQTITAPPQLLIGGRRHSGTLGFCSC